MSGRGAQEMVLLGGCFWGTEHAFSGMPGVLTQAGYAGGGSLEPPTYYTLDRSGHSEAVRVRWDPGLVSLAEMLSAFAAKSSGDPSPPGHPRYRRAVLCNGDAQTADVLALRDGMAGSAGFVVETGWVFHPAEPYHQKLYARQQAS